MDSALGYIEPTGKSSAPALVLSGWHYSGYCSKFVNASSGIGLDWGIRSVRLHSFLMLYLHVLLRTHYCALHVVFVANIHLPL